MKKYFIIIILTITVFVISCTTVKINEEKNIKLFTTEQIDEKFIKFTKRPTSLTTDDNSLTESVYSILLPNEIKKYLITVSSIPNEVTFEFSNKQKILILENTTAYQEKSFLNLSKQNFEKELSNLKIYSSKIDSEAKSFKKLRFFSIRITKDYLIVCINVKEDQTKIFEKSIKSFEITK